MTQIEMLLSYIKGMIHNFFKVGSGTTGKNTTITGTSAITGDWMCFEVLADAVVASYTEDNTPDTRLAAVSLSQGVFVYGKITSITLTSGIVKAYGNINMTI